MADSDDILKRDQELLRRFLIMIRDYYKMADEATYFLETKMGISNIHGIANLRDSMSHFAAFLGNTDASKREGHLVAAEEHVRRAIVEAYETGIDALTVRFMELYENYMARLLPIKDRYQTLRDAPNRISIDATLQAIRKLEVEGRSVKTKRLWEPQWEQGTFSFVQAFDSFQRLYSEMNEYWCRYEQLGRDRKQTWLTVWSIVATVLTTVLGIALAAVLSK